MQLINKRASKDSKRREKKNHIESVVSNSQKTVDTLTTSKTIMFLIATRLLSS